MPPPTIDFYLLIFGKAFGTCNRYVFDACNRDVFDAMRRARCASSTPKTCVLANEAICACSSCARGSEPQGAQARSLRARHRSRDGRAPPEGPTGHQPPQEPRQARPSAFGPDREQVSWYALPAACALHLARQRSVSCMWSVLRPLIQKKSWRRCDWADLCPVPSGLGYETQYLVDANGALPPPARSVVPAISTDCHRVYAGSSVADRRAPMRQSTRRPQEPPIRVRRASQPGPRRPSLRPPSRPSRSGCRSSSL